MVCSELSPRYRIWCLLYCCSICSGNGKQRTIRSYLNNNKVLTFGAIYSWNVRILVCYVAGSPRKSKFDDFVPEILVTRTRTQTAGKYHSKGAVMSRMY